MFQAGTCESRERGTRNGSKLRAARYHHRTGRVFLFTGLDWTHPKICKMPFSV